MHIQVAHGFVTVNNFDKFIDTADYMSYNTNIDKRINREGPIMRKPHGIARGRGKFCCYWWFVGWWAVSFGFHISFKEPNIELHLPFGFIRIGIEQ